MRYRNLCLCVNGCNSSPRQVPDYAVEFEKKPFSPRSFDSRQAITNVLTFFPDIKLSSFSKSVIHPAALHWKTLWNDPEVHHLSSQGYIVDYFLKPHACSETNFTGTFCCYVWHLRLIHLLYQIIDNETECHFQNEHMFFSFFL